MMKTWLLGLILFLATPCFARNVCREFGMQHGLFSIKTDGSDLRLLRQLNYPPQYPKINYDKLHVSPDGKRLVYLRCLKDMNDSCQCDSYIGVKEVVVSDFDGSNEVVVSPDKGGFNDYPNWSPDSNSVIYMHSEKDTVADLYTYSLLTQSRTQITQTPSIQESDNFWNLNDEITAVVKDYSVKGSSNFIVKFPLFMHANPQRLTEPRTEPIRHCCFADPKFSYSGKYLSYSKFDKDNGAEGDWDIILRSVATGFEQDLSTNDLMDLYPLFSRDHKKMFWTRYDHVRKVVSYVVLDFQTGQQSSFDIFGEGVSHHLNGKKLLFGGLKWADWFHPYSDRIIFPATFGFEKNN